MINMNRTNIFSFGEKKNILLFLLILYKLLDIFYLSRRGFKIIFNESFLLYLSINKNFNIFYFFNIKTNIKKNNEKRQSFQGHFNLKFRIQNVTIKKKILKEQ